MRGWGQKGQFLKKQKGKSKWEKSYSIMKEFQVQSKGNELCIYKGEIVPNSYC